MGLTKWALQLTNNKVVGYAIDYVTHYTIIIIPLHHYYTIYTLHIMEIVNKLWNYEIGFNSSNTHPAG